jgi:lysozyme
MIDGIDVAYPQGIIDWKAVADSGKIKFACTKVTQGLKAVDPQFKNDWNGIASVGLIRGAYHFADTSNDPVAEANHFMDTLGQPSITDFLALDIEVSSLSGVMFVHWVVSWLETVEQKTGKIPFIYTGGPFFNQHSSPIAMLNYDLLKRYPLWLAGYVTNPDNFLPEVWKKIGWILWQKAGDIAAPGDSPLHVPGIKGVVDHDVFRGTEDQLKQLILNLHTGQDNDVSSMVSTIVSQAV